ncbi:MAG: hypothetical protein L0287_29755 [Anaerolineae bacterium]|nr:hypothetical protein [Anaerolineae bacterium]MCI0607892.1 hypothetical protein [Anaerolineae bacterium]
MCRKLSLLVSLFGFLAACAAPTASPIPTPYPPEFLPTVIALTAEAASIAGTQTAIALTPTSRPTRTRFPTFTPTIPPTPTVTDFPWHKPAVIEIQAPGPMSRVISPINLRMNIIAGESEKVQIDLYGEDGRLLSRTLKTVRTSREGVLQNVKIPFEIRATAEVGRVTVSTQDKAGRLQALNSVRILMLSSGANEINPPGNPSEPVGVFSPLAEESVTGGVLNVRGDLWPFNLQPVILELVGPDGRSIGLRILTVDHINPQLFETTIPYKVREPTLARLTIYQDDDRINGLFYVYSQEVLLNP